MMLGVRSWRWLLLVVPLALPGCIIFGGQTGEDSACASEAPPNRPCDRSRSLGFKETSSLGFSAAEMVTQFGGTKTGTVDTADAELWQALGLEPAPELPLSVALSIAHENGPTHLDECAGYLSVEVTVSLDLGQGLLNRTGIGVLKGNGLWNAVILHVDLSPPSPADKSTASVTAELQLFPSYWYGVIVPADRATTAASARAEMQGP